MHTVNGALRLRHFTENNVCWPSHEALEPHLMAERAWLKLSLRELDEEDEVAPGWRFGVPTTWLNRSVTLGRMDGRGGGGEGCGGGGGGGRGGGGGWRWWWW